MQGARTRMALGAKGAWAKAHLSGRAERFARRSKATFPDFAALAGWPAWVALDEPRQLRVGVVAALLASREALAEEIDGAKLRAYAQVVGAETLDAITGEGGNGGDACLPAVDDLAETGRNLLTASLDTGAARLFGTSAQHDPAAVELVRRAENLCGGIDRA